MSNQFQAESDTLIFSSPTTINLEISSSHSSDLKLKPKHSTPEPALRCNQYLSTCTKLICVLFLFMLVATPYILGLYGGYFMGNSNIIQYNNEAANVGTSGPYQRKRKNSTLEKNLGPAIPYEPVSHKVTLKELELQKSFFFLYSHSLPPKFKIHDPIVDDQECPAKDTQICVGNGKVVDLKTFTLPQTNYGSRCGSIELTDSTFCINRNVVIDLNILTLLQRVTLYDRLLEFVPEPEEFRKAFEPPSADVKLEIVLMEMIPIKSPRLVKAIYNIANIYGGTGASLTLLICPIHYKSVEFLEDEEGQGWKGVNIIQLGREYGPEEFQEMLTSQWLSEYYEGKQILLLHPDTMLLRPITTSMISDKFDIIGKPYSFEVSVLEDPPPSKQKKETVKTKEEQVNPEKRDSSEKVQNEHTDKVSTTKTAETDDEYESATQIRATAATSLPKDSKIDNDVSKEKRDESKEEELKKESEKDGLLLDFNLNEGNNISNVAIRNLEMSLDPNSTTIEEPAILVPRASIEAISVGNTATGYSLRRRDKIREIVAESPSGQKPIPEDEYWYSKMTPAPPEISIQFSISGDVEVDQFSNHKYTHVPTGVYAIWKFPKLFGKVGGRILRKFVHDNIYLDGDDPKLLFAPKRMKKAEV